MFMDKQLEYLKSRYMDIPVPHELNAVVEKTIRRHKRRAAYKKSIAGIAAAVILMVAAINTSPAFASSLSHAPLVGSLVKVLTFKEIKVADDSVKADIQVPAVVMDNKTLEATLNSKYLEESTKLYQDFMTEVEELKQNGGGHLGVESGYVVKTDNEQLLALGRYVVNTVGSSSTTFKYDTVDKKKQLLLTLPSLFKDERYIGLISENIKAQMRQQMKEDSKKVYWVEGSGSKVEEFKVISPKQNFYVNNEGELVIVFDKYEAAPGYMGVLEFTIPSDVIADALVSREYIK